MKLTTRQAEALRRVAWGTEHFGALVSGRQTHVKVLRALVKKGLVRHAGLVAVCDGDGFLVQFERYRQGWVLTNAGAKALEATR